MPACASDLLTHGARKSYQVSMLAPYASAGTAGPRDEASSTIAGTVPVSPRVCISLRATGVLGDGPAQPTATKAKAKKNARCNMSATSGYPEYSAAGLGSYTEQEFDSGQRRLGSVSFIQRLRASLGKAREAFSAVQRLGRAAKPLTPEFWEELEETLILADFGVPTTQKIVTGLQTVAKQEAWKTTDQPIARFRKDVERFLTLPGGELHLEKRPAVMLVVGVNGSGKTTTIGKLATRLRGERKRVVLVAADTFRAAAAEQLAIWAERSKSE